MPDDTRVVYRIPKSSQTSSTETLELARTWIQDCEMHHELCRHSGTVESWYPTRLLDLGQTIPGDETVACRIVVSGSVVLSGDYATVSHRWGTANFLKLTAENMVSFKHGIPYSALPQTFIDCITVARQLKIRYLWIDSLCIIQSGDGGKDWQDEASTMHLVFGNAACNIVSNWQDASGGLFSQRDLRLFDQLQIDLNIFSKGTSHRANFVSVEDMLWKEEVSLSPINKRGWVLQERLLSRRNLHFCRREVFFECRHSACCESVPNSKEFREFFGVEDTFLKLALMQPEEALKVIPEGFEPSDDWKLEWAYKAWTAIVNTYSQCQLTFDSDKLIALAGIATHIKPIINDTYVAGLWLRDLPLQLLWNTATGTEQESPPKTVAAGYRAPSFSWASVDLPVELAYRENKTIIVDASCVVFRHPEMVKESESEDRQVTEDFFGPISSSTVEVKVIGRIVPAKVVPSKFDPSWRKGFWICPLGYEGEEPSTLEDMIFPRLDTEPSKSQLENLNTRTIYYLPLIYEQSFKGLLLEGVDSKMGRFRRIGVLSGFSAMARHIYMEDWGHEHEVESWRYNCETGFHTIYIV